MGVSSTGALLCCLGRPLVGALTLPVVSGGVGGAPGTYSDLLRIGYYIGRMGFKVLTLPALELIFLWDGLCSGQLLGPVVG